MPCVDNAHELPRLRFHVTRPKLIRDLIRNARPRGRNLSLNPLLVAMDAVCRQEFTDLTNDGIAILTPGATRGRPRTGPRLPEPDAFAVALACRWRIEPTTARNYLYEDKRYYYPRAYSIVELLAGPMFDFTKDEIANAVAEHLPENRGRDPLPLADNGILFNLYPCLVRPRHSETGR